LACDAPHARLGVRIDCQRLTQVSQMTAAPASCEAPSAAMDSQPPTPLRARSQRPWLEEPSLVLRERLAGAPPGAVIKGWLFQSLGDGARAHGVELDAGARRLGFKDYPLAEYLEALAEAAVRVRPDLRAKETLRLLGRGVYGSFAQSLLGKVVLAGIGSGKGGARTGLQWVARVYKLTSNHATARFSTLAGGPTTIVLSDVWTFPDSYHVGIFEGAAEALGGSVSVDVESHSLCAATLTVRWES